MTKQLVQYWALIPAAGVGRRMGADRPKQYLPLAGRTVIEHALDPFLEDSRIAGVIVVLDEKDLYWPVLPIATDPRVAAVAGGAERCHSVLNGLYHLSTRADPDDWVLVHDAARPCLARADLNLLLDSLSEEPVGGILATPVRDTLKRADSGQTISGTIDRSGAWHALTPQMFRLGALTSALEKCLAEGALVTDESSAMEMTGRRPRLVEGRADNIKITLREDLALAEYYLKRSRDEIL